ncbi:hypothetical protein RclHR1_19250001 [Rhizophagus clarus]|uniref:CipC-like antibiotic response protein, putative n=1 Tax=Rhizophagus clarus TaxID=94130 RepID=A0A2Z6QND8_9GLOM|nr:hypothetical protein RclHR1_19250001 [Rhizophagus clarus]GES95341.1 CipC-like antibiotic response protein, putative [Rhizophagus clarus]
MEDFLNLINHSKAEEHHKEIYGKKKHEGKLSHELIAGAVGFEAYKAYEKKCAEDGHPSSHALAKEIIAGIAAAEIDKLIETKGLDLIDEEKAKHHAKEAAKKLYSENYENDD